MYAIKEIAIKPEKHFEALDGIWTCVIHAPSVMF